MKYMLLSGKHYRRENGNMTCYWPGDVVELSEDEARAFSDRFEVAAEQEFRAEQEFAAGSQPGAEQEVPAGLLEASAAAALEAAGITTLGQLAALAADPEALEKVKGIGKAKARKIRESLMALETTMAEEING